MFGILGLLDAAVSVAYHVVTDFTQVLTPLAGAGVAAAAAIVAFTLAVRLLLSPLSYVALRGQAAQARLQPQIQELRRRYARQPDRLQRELAALYQREGGGLLAGCLPLLAQLPFFSVMYRLFRSAFVAGHPNLLLARRLLGVPLGAHWLGAAGPLSAGGLVFLGLFALLLLVGWLSARLATQPAALTSPVPRASAGPARPAAQVAGQEKVIAVLTRLLPYTTVVIALFVPLAAGLYLLTTTAWTVAERAVLRRRAHQSATRKAAAAGTNPAADRRNNPAAGNAASLRRKRPGRRVEGNAARSGN